MNENELPSQSTNLNASWNLLGHLRDNTEHVGKEEVYYYHTDHLGSSSWITYTDGTPVQYMSYMPFGELQIDHRDGGDWHSRYTFSGKERDEETGYSYFGARYYDADLSIWLSRDPLAHLYPHQSPYAYCSNNPIGRVDPNGMADGEFYNWYGKYLGCDGNKDDKIFIVSDEKDQRNIKKNEKNGESTNSNSINIDLSTTKETLKETINVYNRTEKNGGDNEEATTYDMNNVRKRYQTGNGNEINIDKEGNVSIHSHPLNETSNRKIYTTDISENDKEVFPGYQLNIIVGKSNCDSESFGCVRTPEASFYNNNLTKIGTMSIKDMNKILNTK